MNNDRSTSTLSLPLFLIAFLLISTLIIVNNTNSSSINAVKSRAEPTELIVEHVKNSQQDKVIKASGHFANNQIQNGSVTWIQGGLWDLVVRNNTNTNNTSTAPVSSPKAAFSANFTMVKPDGSESHIHSINNFVSNNVIIGGGDMVITGIGNIYTDGALKFKQVPITVHLMGRQHVLGLIIDTVKTENHYASTHEMFGTLINGAGLEKIEKTLVMPTKSQSAEQQNRKSMNMPMNMG